MANRMRASFPLAMFCLALPRKARGNHAQNHPPQRHIKEFDAPSVTGLQVAQAIGPRLAKDAIGALVDGELRDLSASITKDAKIAIVTPKSEGPQRPLPLPALRRPRHGRSHHPPLPADQARLRPPR